MSTELSPQEKFERQAVWARQMARECPWNSKFYTDMAKKAEHEARQFCADKKAA